MVAFGIYVASILKGKTKPNRVTWWILAAVQLVIVMSYYSSGARDTIWLPAVYAICFSVVGILSVRYGEGPVTLDRTDRLSLVGAAISIGVWAVLHSPVPALYIGIATDFIGLVPTIYKAYRRPETESLNAWAVASIASVMNIVALSDWSFVISSYPMYVLLTNIGITYFISRRKPLVPA
jgi:hypothetical protein